MSQNISELYNYRGLLLSWISRELKLRYKQAFIGGLWAIIQPVILMGLFVIVFSIFVRLPTEGIPYPVFAYTAVLPWTYFATSLSVGIPSLVTNMNLVTKIYFPREVLPLASIGAALVDFFIASLVLVILMAVYEIPLRVTVLWVPILVLVQTIFTTGIVLFASMLNAFYRDVRFMIPLAIQVWMYASPIIYPLSSVPDWLRPFYILNPMAGIIDSYRRVLLKGLSPDPLSFGIAVAMAFLFLGLGYFFFKRWEGILPDVI